MAAIAAAAAAQALWKPAFWQGFLASRMWGVAMTGSVIRSLLVWPRRGLRESGDGRVAASPSHAGLGCCCSGGGWPCRGQLILLRERGKSSTFRRVGATGPTIPAAASCSAWWGFSTEVLSASWRKVWQRTLGFEQIGVTFPRAAGASIRAWARAAQQKPSGGLSRANH